MAAFGLTRKAGRRAPVHPRRSRVTIIFAPCRSRPPRSSAAPPISRTCATTRASVEIALGLYRPWARCTPGTLLWPGRPGGGQPRYSVDLRQPDAVRAERGPFAVSAGSRWGPREARLDRGRRRVRARGGGALSGRGRHAGAGRASRRASLRAQPSRTLRGRRDRRREAIRRRRSEHRRLRKEGLPAASGRPSHGARSVLARRDRRCPDRPRAGRPGDELAQRVPVRRRAGTSASARRRARRRSAGLCCRRAATERARAPGS